MKRAAVAGTVEVADGKCVLHLTNLSLDPQDAGQTHSASSASPVDKALLSCVQCISCVKV